MILLLGIIGIFILKHASFKETLCNYRITQNLQNFQNHLANLFTTAYFARKSVQIQDIQTIFNQHNIKNTPQCSLLLDPKKLTINVKNHNLKTIFYITPKNLTMHPQIKCLFSNPLCKKIHHRISNK
ncbi:hypothetical protein LW135_06480 [Helicobacter sp. faydin-H20]|uniref:hypothetical protein n=1 Tax=Helicobacter anatolicus TaxID=2905874 RepID=UPI001E2AD9D6|nr:hypothetical protein [Helicobacter anatolicus]MCE3037466.1 hypothetical protein [Helicobacter anatolicus]